MNHRDQIKKILIAIDGSEHSLAAVKLVSELPIQSLPQGENCLVTALGVLLLRDASDHATYMIPLKQAKKILKDAGYQVVIDLVLGYPAEVITNYAESHTPDLIVLGAKGLRATFGILLGGVAQQVVEYACCPVLVVRSPYMGIARALLAIDGSESSQLATQYMSRFPFSKDTKLYVVHVLPPAPILKPDYLIKTWSIAEEAVQDYPIVTEQEEQEMREEQEKLGEIYVSQTMQYLKSCGISASSTILRGDAATEIIEYAKKTDIDLIIAGSRGLSQMRSWLVGSVSRKLVHYAPCSVLLVKSALKSPA
jgi:nucleotide-binding universal stress UspA family protein